MFKIQYEFQKGGPLYACTYPKEQHENNNIFIMKGKNDQGKSTLMQMIALGLYGLEFDTISDALKEKIRRLTSEDTDKCIFNIIIQSKDSKIKVESHLEEGAISLFINGEKKGYDYLKNHYTILFDVPEDPTKKLISSLTSIKFNLNQYSKYVKKYNEEITKAYETITNYQQKEQRKETLTKEIKKKEERINNLRERLLTVKGNLEEQNNIIIVHLFEQLDSELTELRTEEDIQKNRIRRLRKIGAGGGTPSYQKKVKLCKDALQQLRIKIRFTNDLANVIEDQNKKELNKFVIEINNTRIISDLSTEKIKTWARFFWDIQKSLQDSNKGTLQSEAEEIIDLLDKLISVLKDYIEVDTTIPGTDGKKVNQFLTDLENQKAEYEEQAAPSLSLKNAMNSLKEINDDLDTLSSCYLELPRDKPQENEYQLTRDRIDDIMGEIRQKGKLKLKIEDNYKNLPSKERNALRMKKQPDQEANNALEKEIKEREDKIKSLDIQIGSDQKQLDEYKKMKKPQFEYDIGQLKHQRAIAEQIRHKIVNWMELIEKLEYEFQQDKRSSNSQNGDKTEKLNENKALLLDALGEYFAQLLEVIYFENKPWHVTGVDLTRYRYLVKNRKPISFIDIGTGHTALNSLLTKIKQNYGDKKKILLFDEIGIMDDDNLNRLLTEIRKRVDTGEVILAILSIVDKKATSPELVPV